MKARSILLSIPESCGQSWSEMTPLTSGRHCGSCDKSVVDFTSFSDLQIVQHIQSSQGEICGRFSNRQLNRELPVPSVPRFSGLSLAVMVALAITMTSVPAYGQQTVNAPTAVVRDTLTAGKQKTLPPVTISGTVKDLSTGEPVYFVAVKLQYQGNRIAEVMADANGFFSFEINEDQLFDSLVVSDFGESFSEVRVAIDSSKLTGIELVVEPEAEVTMGAIVIIKNPDPWYPLEFFSHEDLAPRNKKPKKSLKEDH